MTKWLPVKKEALPRELFDLPAAVWRAEPRKGHPEKWNKAPLNPKSLLKIGANNPSAFGSLEEAIKTYESSTVTGVGILLINNGLIGIDIDDVDELLAGEDSSAVAGWLERARTAKAGAAPAYIERSPSGKGLRVFLKGYLRPDSRCKRGGLEIYANKRFLTLTGTKHPKFSPKFYEINQRQDLIDEFVQLIDRQAEDRKPLSSKPQEFLIDQVCAAIKSKKPDLWSGQWELSRKYKSQSEADLALLSYIGAELRTRGVILAHLPGIIEICFSRSKLFRIDKLKTLQNHSIPKILSGYSDKTLQLKSVSDSFSGLILRDEDVEKMRDADFLIPNMIVRGHLAAYIAPGNGGKTTIFTHLSGILAKGGAEVFYINVDGSPGDLKRHKKHAADHGYQIIAPDARVGGSIDAVSAKLREFASSSAELSNIVFIFDTLKKFVNVIEKREARAFYQLMRALTVKGATICLLGHSNKYKDKDNQQIFEGTADLRNDVDELIYFDVFANEKQRTLEITTRPDKVRAEFSPKSFVIHMDEDRKVTEPDGVITVMEKAERSLLEQIIRAISRGHTSQKDIIGDVRQTAYQSDKKIREILIKHSREGSLIRSRSTGRGKDLEYSLVDPSQSFPF